MRIPVIVVATGNRDELPITGVRILHPVTLLVRGRLPLIGVLVVAKDLVGLDFRGVICDFTEFVDIVDLNRFADMRD